MTAVPREAGRALDVLVADKVFGRIPLTREEMVAEAQRVWKDQPDCQYFLKGFHAWRDGDDIITDPIAPRYSTDIAAAWLVVEKVAMQVEIRFDVAGGWRAEFWDAEGSRSARTFAATAPLAICLAALGVSPAGRPGETP